MAGLGTGAPIVKVYHEKSMILPDVSRVLACLYEKGIEFERHHTASSYKGLLRLQASSHVPVPFYDGLTFLEESREICRYIAETYEHRGDPFLLGKDSLERASIEQWLHNEEHAFNPPSRSLFCHLAFPLTEEDDDIDLQKIKLEEVLEVYEQRLGDTEFLAGNKFTLADLVHLPNSHYITESDKFAYLYDSRKNVQRWWNAISTRKSWQNVLKDIQVVEQLRKQEEFEKQQQRQRRREYRPTTRRQIHLDSRKQDSTKSQTILVPPPVGIVSTSPTAFQAEKPPPTETSPDETLLSTPTTHKSSAVQSKHATITTHQETPPTPVQSTPRLPGYPHIPVQSTPTTVENPSRTGADIPDNTATNADTQDKKSVRYTDYTPQRSAETIYGGSTDQRVTYTSPGKHGSTEAHQKLQTEQWHGTAAGLSNLKGETDYLVPTQQVKPGKDVQYRSSQDSEQVSTHPPAQEPVSMDRQLVQGPEMTPRTPYSDQKRDVSSMPWQQTADVRGITEEDKASSDHRDAVQPPYARKHAEEAKIASADHRKDASSAKHVIDKDTQAIPLQTAYDDAHDVAQEARETASAPRRRRAQDAYDTSEGIGTYHSSSSRLQPINAPQDAAPPPKKAASEGPRRVTAPYPAAQEFIEQTRESPASRSTVPRDAQGNTEEEPVESSSSKAHLLDSRLADVRPPKKYLDEDGYGEIVPLQTGSADDPYYRKRDRDIAAPKRMMPQDTFEERKMSDSASFEAQTVDHRQADAPSQKQRLDEDPQTIASPRKERYSGGEDTTEQSKTSASWPRRMAAQEIQDNFEDTKAGDSRSTRERPSDSWQALVPTPRHEADDVRSRTAPSQKRYPDDDAGIKDRHGAISPSERRYADAEDTTKHSRDTAFKPSKIVGQDAEDTSEEAEARKSTLFREQPQDARRVATTPSKQAAEDSLNVSRSSPKRYPRAEETSKEPRAAASKPTHTAAQDARDVFRESKVADSTSSIEQPSDARAAASFQKQEVPDARNTSASFQKRYPDVKGATKKSKVTFEETKSPDSASSQVQPLDSQRDYAPSWKQEATEAPRATTPFKKRDSNVEDTTEHPGGAFKPRKMVGQDTQGTYEEAKASDSGFPREQAADTWQAATTPTEKVATEDGPRGTPPSERNAPNDVDTSTQPRGTTSAPRRTTAGDASGAFQESMPADSVSSRGQPLRARQPVVTPRKETEDSLSKISAFHKTRPIVDDSTRPAVDTVFEPRQIGAEDTKDITEETKVADSASPVRARPTYTPRPARPLSEQAEVEDDAWDKDREGRETISAPKKMVSRDGEHTYGERKIPHSASRGQSLDNLQASSPLKQAAAEDPHGASRGAKESLVDETKHSQGVKGASKKSVVTFEETKDPASALSTAQPLSAQDAQYNDRSSRTPTADQRKDASTPQKGLGSLPSRVEAGDEDQAIMDESEQLRKMLKESRSTSSKAQPADSRSPTKEERTPSAYQEDHLVAPDNREQPQILTTGVRADHSTPKRQQAPVVPPPTPPRANVYDDQEAFKTDPVDDPKRASGTFQESKPADSVSSREQAFSARQPVVTPSRQETEDSLSKISAFHKTRPFVEDSTRPAVDTVFEPRKIGAEDTKDITEETKVADSASPVRARPTYAPRTARPLSEQAEVEEDARDKGREGRETISGPKKMVSRDGEHKYGDRKIPHSASREQSLDNLQASSPLKQAAAEDSRGATSGGAKESLVDEPKESQGVKGASKRSAGTFQETKDPASILPTTQPLSAQDDQRTDRSYRTPTADQGKDVSTQPQSNNQDTYKEARSSSAHQKGLGSSPSHAEAGDEDQAIMGEKVFPSEQLRKMIKESTSASSKAQPADSQSPAKVERTPSVYQEDHLVAPDSREQPQTLPTGVRADGSKAKRQQAPVVPSTSEEKSTHPTPPRAKAHDDHTTEGPFKRDTVDDPKGTPLLLGQEPTSRVQRATELTPDGDISSKPSNIDQWRRTSAPTQGVTPNSGDDVLGVSTIDQKPTPMSQQSIPSARGVNEMVKREQRRAPSAPAGAQTPDVQHAPPSFAGPEMAERDGEPAQMQARTLHAHPTSVPTRRETPDARDPGDNEFANPSDAQRWKALKAKHDSAMIDEDVPDSSLSVHDATGDNKTTWHASEAQVSDTLPSSTAAPVNVRPTSGDELVERFSRDQGARPPESTQAQTPFDAPRDSVSTQGVPSDAMDKTKFAKPSSNEGMTPTAGPASALEAKPAELKYAPSDEKSARTARPLSSDESRKEDTSVSAADQIEKPQTIFRQQARPSTPITKQVPSSNVDRDKRKIQQATLDNLPTDDSPTPHVPSYEQVSRAPQTIPSERDIVPAPGTSDSPASNTQIASAKFQEAIADSYRPDELTVPFVSSEKQGSYSEPHEGPSHDAHDAADDKDVTKYPSKQAPVLEYRPDSTSADSYVRPTSGDEPGISPDQGAESPTAAQATNSENRRSEVFPTEKKSTPSDQDSVHSVQQPFPAETRRGKTFVAAAEQTLPTNIGQQHTQDMREAPTSDVVPAEDIPSDARSGRPDEVPLVEQKFASSDQDRALASSVEPIDEDIRNSTRSAQPLFSAADYQSKDPQKTTIGQQDVAPTPGTSKSPSLDTHDASGQLQEVAPDDRRTVESLPSQGQVSRAKPSFVVSEGPTRDSLDIDRKSTEFPSSQVQNSDPKPDSTQNRGDEPPTRFVPNQLSKQPAETRAPPLVGPDESKSNQDVTSDTLGKPKSLKPSSIDQEATGSALTPDTHLGSAPGEVAPAGQKLPLKDQDFAQPTQKSSSIEPTKEESTVTAPNEAKTSPTIFSQQDKVLAQKKMKDPSSGSQYVPQRFQEITPEDQHITGSIPMKQEIPHFERVPKPHDGPTPDPNGAFVKEPMADKTGSIPNAQHGMVPSGLSPDEGKPVISDKDSDHHTQLRSSDRSRKEAGDGDASNQTIMPAQGTSESSGEVLKFDPGTDRSSELTRPLIPSHKQDSNAGHPESHEGANPNAHRALADENKPPPLVSQARSLEAGLNFAPSRVDVIPTSGDEPVAGLTNEHKKQTPATFQASLPHEALDDSIYAESVSPDAFGEVGPLKATGEVTPADQSIAPSEPLLAVESRKESTGAEDEESEVYQPITGQKDIGHAPGISEHVIDDYHNKEPVSREEQVSRDQRPSEPREGSPPDVHGASLDKKTTPPSSQAQGSDPKRDPLPKSVDVNPSSGQHSTTRFLRGQGAQRPALTRSPPLQESLLDPESNEDAPDSSANQNVKSPEVVPASSPDTLIGTASGKIAPDGQNFPLSAQDLARSAQQPFSVEPTEEKRIAASSDQTKEARKIISQRGVTPTGKEKTPFDLQASELAKSPNEDQEQVHAGSAYDQREGPTTDAPGAVDEKTPLPSSQAENSDIVPDSAPISGVADRTNGDARHTSVDGPTTSSLRDSEAQPPTGTQNVPALFLEKIEPPTPTSTDQELMMPMTSPAQAPAPEAPQDQDLTTSQQLSPSVVSRKDVADQTSVSQAGLRERTSPDSTRPSEKIQEFSPDAHLTKSEKPLLMKGADPVHIPYETSSDLSSDEKNTMIKGDQASTISNASLSASLAVGQPGNSAVKGPLSEESVSSFSQKNLTRTSPEEKSKQQQQIDESSTRSSKDDSIEARGTANPNFLSSGDIQQSPVKESMQEAQGSRNQQQAEQPVFQSTPENEMQFEEAEAQDNGSDKPEEIRPDSAPISGTGSDGPATSSLRDSLSQPPAGTLNVPAVFLEKIETPRRPSTDQELMAPMASAAPAPDTPHDKYSTQSPQLSPSVVSRKDVADANQTDVPQAGLRVPRSSDATLPSEKTQEFSPDASLTKSAKPVLPMTGTDPVQPPHEASFDFSSDGKPTVIKGEQANSVSNVSLSASQPVGQSENSAVKRPLSEEPAPLFSPKNLERTLPGEKSKQQQQTDQSSTRSSSDDSMEASGTASPNILTTGDLQPSPLKESMYATEGSRNQEQTDQTVFQSTQDNRKQVQENEAQENGSDRPEGIRPDSAPISGDARRTSGDGPAKSSLRDSQEQPPAGTLNVPAVFLEKMESPRPTSTDQELMTSMTSPAPDPDAPQDQDSTRSPQLSPSVVSRKDVANADKINVSQAGLREPATSDVTRPSEKTQEFNPDAYLTKSEKPLVPVEGSNTVQTPHEASFDLSSDEKTTMTKGDQANRISNVSLSASQTVGQPENSAVKGPLSEESVLERTTPEEKSKQQQQQQQQQKIDQSSTRSSKDDSTEARLTTSPNILTTSGDIQPSPVKESVQTAQGSRNKQQANQAVFQSTQANEKQTEETEAQNRPDSAPISGDARRTSGVFMENIDSRRPPSTDKEPRARMTSPTPAQDAPQGAARLEAATDQDSTLSQLSPSSVSRKAVANAGQTNVSQAGLREPASSDAMRPSEKIQEFSPDAYLTKSVKPLLPMEGTDPVQPPHEASFDLSSDGKPTMIKGDQANTVSNVSLSASQAFGQSENNAVKGPLSEDSVSPFSQKSLEETSPEEKPKQQQQTDQSNTRSFKDDSILDARGTTDPGISTSGDIQPSPLKESMQGADGSRNQQQADQADFGLTLDDEKQFEETEAHVIGPDKLYKTNLQQNTGQKNNGASQRDALEQPGEQVPTVQGQAQSNNMNVGSKPTEDAPGIVEADNKSESSLRTSDESKKQVQTEGIIQDGETKAPASEGEQPEERDLPSRNKGVASQSQAETPSKLKEQTSSGIQGREVNSSKLDGSTDDVKPAADTDDNPPSP